MIGFINTLVTISLNYSQYSDIADLHNLQFTVAHPLGFSVFSKQRISTLKLALQNTMKSSCHFLFSHPGTQLYSPEPKTELVVAVSYREPTWTELHYRVRVRVTLRLTVSQSVCLGVEPRLGLMTRNWKLLYLSLSLYSVRTVHERKTQSYCCIRPQRKRVTW
jgi:hypothetical protein